MIEQWVINQLNPLKGERIVILADPQRMIRSGAQAVDGWAKENGFTVLFCSGNLALREMYESVRGDPSAKVIVVDRTREKARLPLFYPDLEARCKSRARLTITLRDFLVEKTGDERWPLLVNDRNLSRVLLDNLEQALKAHSQLRVVHEHHSDRCKIDEPEMAKRVLLAVGGILPKLQAAADAGCKEVIMPKENEKDVQMVPNYVKGKISVRFVSSIDDVLTAALLSSP